METTKRWFITEALDEIGLSSYAFNLSGSDLMAALRKLDTLIATWEAQGLTINWVFSSNYDTSDPDDAVTVPDASLQAVITNLALRIAPSFGKNVSIETRQAAWQGLNALRVSKATIPQQQYPVTTPIGEGNRTELQKYYPQVDQLEAHGNEVTL